MTGAVKFAQQPDNSFTAYRHPQPTDTHNRQVYRREQSAPTTVGRNISDRQKLTFTLADAKGNGAALAVAGWHYA